MNKLKTVLLLVLVSATGLFAQDSIPNMKQIREQLVAQQKFYGYTDSLFRAMKPGFLESSVYQLADSLDKSDPTSYFMKIPYLIKDQRLNEAGFIFYLGLLRFRYYNSVDPDYEAGSGGALLASFKYEMGEVINPYLKINVANCIAILNESLDWYVKNDYRFFSKNKNLEKYDFQATGMRKLITDMEKNKEKYQKQWADEREVEEKSTASELNKIDQELKKKVVPAH